MQMSHIKDSTELCLSPDELMLKELERRDGIYSFIFHELEAPKSKTIKTGETIITSNGHTNAIVVKQREHLELQQQQRTIMKTNEFMVEQQRQQHMQVSTSLSSPTTSPPPPVLPSLSLPSLILPTMPTATTSVCFSNFSNIISNAKSSSNNNTNMNNFSSNLNSNSTTTTITNKPYSEYLKSWHPPPTLLYDHPKLYAYMAHCGFRVRIPTPRFSHISVPLVRNRRHALKDTPEYKLCNMCLCKIPDLRALFPHDPDVHAPFTDVAMHLYTDCGAPLGNTSTTTLSKLPNSEMAI